MIDLEAIKKAIADSVELATEIEVIYANQDAPRPKESYATVFVTPSSRLGFDRITYTNGAGAELDEAIDGHRLLMASISFFKENAFINASTFLTKLQSNSQITFFKNNGLGFVSTSEIRDLSEVDKNLWEERAQLDLTFHALSNFSEEVIAVQEANVEGVTESGNNVNDVSINIK